MDMLLHDATLWVLISFAVFMIAAFVLGRKLIIGSLDEKITKIRSEIEASDRLRLEAIELLAQYQDKQKNAEVEAKRIIDQAVIEAKKVQVTLDAEFEDSIKRREQMLKDRITRMQNDARDDIRKYAAELAMSATSEIISQKMDQNRATLLNDESIKAAHKYFN
jgi:F-type H+-transporting ATPase subunit b